MRRHPFSLVEVLVSAAIFAIALTLISPHLQMCSKSMKYEKEYLEAQNAVEEAVHIAHTLFFEHENMTYDQLLESLKEREVNGFTIVYSVAGRRPVEDSAGGVYQLMIDVDACKDSTEKSLATRRMYVCVKTT